jgi:hypothetical protein
VTTRKTVTDTAVVDARIIDTAEVIVKRNGRGGATVTLETVRTNQTTTENVLDQERSTEASTVTIPTTGSSFRAWKKQRS